MTNEDVAVKVAEVEQRSKSNTHRIDKLEQQNEAIQKIATSVEILALENKHQTEATTEIKNDITKLTNKVDTLEKKPGKRWENVVDIVFKLIVTAIVTMALAKIGLG